MEALILTEIRNQIAFLTINRPQQLNALNKDTIAALHAALAAADTDPNVGVVILTGSGEKAFVAGADIKEFADFTSDGKITMLHLNFDNRLTYDQYIQNKILAWKATNNEIQLSSFEFVYDEKKLPECGCKL